MTKMLNLKSKLSDDMKDARYQVAMVAISSNYPGLLGR